MSMALVATPRGMRSKESKTKKSKMKKKILEEAGEVWLAAEHEGDEALAEEISQLLYHLQTLMLARGLSINDVYKYL